jgi:hypothetical protein
VKRLFAIYLAVNVLDLVLTGTFLTPDTEANPAASAIWSNFGFGGLITYKILMVSIVGLGLYAAIRLEWELKERWVKTILVIGIIMTALACLSFVFTLT